MELHCQEEESATTIFKGLAISLSPKTISWVTTLPLGVIWCKEEKQVTVIVRKNFFLSKEKHVKYNNGVRRESLPYPSDEVTYHILKYISWEGRLSVVYSFHFRLLWEVIFKAELPLSQRISVHHFLLHSIMDMSQKAREGKHQHLVHHGLMKLIMVDALNHLRIPFIWNKFVDMDRDTFIETQVLTPREAPTSSVRGREGKEKEEEGEKIEEEEAARTKEEERKIEEKEVAKIGRRRKETKE